VLGALYNAIWYPSLPLVLLALCGRDSDARRQRMGRVDPAVSTTRAASRIWLHAASVGEIEGAAPVAAGLLAELPDAALFVTTMTDTGRQAAARCLAVARSCMLAPLDHPAAARAFVESIKPTLLLVAETELWPNCFFEARRNGARIAIINGRLSARSLRGYLFARPLFARALASVDLLLAQTSDDGDRFARLGVPRQRIVVTGNPKTDSRAEAAALRPELARFAAGRPILVAGSTAPGEEMIVLDAFATLRARFGNLALVLAPRHPERGAEVAAMLASRTLSFTRASGSAPSNGAADVLLLDTMGELRTLYARAAIALVGGSIVRGRGGQNLAEPAFAGVPVLFGPYHDKQRDVASALLAADGARIVAGADAIAAAAAELLSDSAARTAMGARARIAMAPLGGAIARSIAHLRPLAGLG
jgi:3-deoxy-D-manno-octulosonic-acid transferase